VVPTLNEEEAIGNVIDELKQEGYNKILVVDGYSTDNTVKIAEDGGARVILQHGRGKTGAIKTAIEAVDTPYILVMDGDFTYDPRDIEKLLNHASKYAQVIGARRWRKDNMSRLHRLGNWIITRAFNLLMGTALSDVCSGMYILRTDEAKRLELHTTGFNLEVEIESQMATRETVTELPINYRPRKGRKKLSTWREGFEIITTIINLARFYNPAALFASIAGLSIIPAVIILAWVAAEVLFMGRWHSIYVLVGIMLLLLASQALTVATISVLLRRIESRMTRRIREIKA